MDKRKGTNNDIQNITQKTKNQATQTQLNTRSERMCSGSVSSSCSTCGTRRVNLERVSDSCFPLSDKFSSYIMPITS